MLEGKHTDLYEPLADLLAETGTAAELNTHKAPPDPAFFRLCIERGVKVAFATDSHCLAEVGQMAPHLRILREAAGREDVGDLLFIPPPREDRQ